MRRMRLVEWLGIVGLVILLGWLAKLWWPVPALPVPAGTIPKLPHPPMANAVGNQILASYGDPSAKPEEDLTLMHRALGNFTLLVKGANPLPLGANEEIAAALMGKNARKMVFLQAPTPALNEAQQLIDRWGTPLYFHAQAKDRIEIRSAGPDKIMWSEDDLHRNADGQFRRGAALNPDSLFGP